MRASEAPAHASSTTSSPLSRSQTRPATLGPSSPFCCQHHSWNLCRVTYELELSQRIRAATGHWARVVRFGGPELPTHQLLREAEIIGPNVAVSGWCWLERCSPWPVYFLLGSSRACVSAVWLCAFAVQTIALMRATPPGNSCDKTNPKCDPIGVVPVAPWRPTSGEEVALRNSYPQNKGERDA